VGGGVMPCPSLVTFLKVNFDWELGDWEDWEIPF
jgi:hypothetical protein